MKCLVTLLSGTCQLGLVSTALLAMGVTIGRHDGFCICDLDEQATELSYITCDFGDMFCHICKTTLGDWEKATRLR